MPVLSGRIISSSDAIMALVVVYNRKTVSCLDNALTGNQAATFYFQVGTYSIVPSHHFARAKYMYIFGLVYKKTSLLVKTHVFFMTLHIYKKYIEGY